MVNVVVADGLVRWEERKLMHAEKGNRWWIWRAGIDIGAVTRFGDRWTVISNGRVPDGLEHIKYKIKI
jgi:hypothetical protein